MRSKPTDWKPGDEATAGRLNEWAEYSTGLPFTAGGGLAMGGNALSRQDRGWILARLSGGSSPYSFVSQVDGGPGVLVDGSTTGTANAYEVNGVSGLASKVVRLYPDGHGKYNFQYLNCCSSGCATGSLAFTVTGCSGAAVSGATVSVTGPGGFSASGTTNGSGQVTFSVAGYPAGSYPWTVTYSPNFASSSGTKTVSCNVTNSVSVSLSPASGYTCLSGCCGNIPMKNNLFLTTPFGTTVAFDYNALGGGKWEAVVVENLSCRKGAGCVTSSTEACTFYWSMGTGCTPLGFSTGTVGGKGAYDITTSPPTMICDNDLGCTNKGATIQPQVSTTPTRTCAPFSVTYNAEFDYSPFDGTRANYGTVTVTE